VRLSAALKESCHLAYPLLSSFEEPVVSERTLTQLDQCHLLMVRSISDVRTISNLSGETERLKLVILQPQGRIGWVADRISVCNQRSKSNRCCREILICVLLC